MITRRTFLTSAGLGLTNLTLGINPLSALVEADSSGGLSTAFHDMEKRCGGRLGVGMLDIHTGIFVGHRANERFPMCSTFKVLAAGALLKHVDQGHENLSRRIRFNAADLQTYSPVTKSHAGGEGMTLSEICQAALQYSDNTAANILLAQIGGPAGLTRYARSLGDTNTRLDRTEPSLNEATPGDPRDTTIPEAMLLDLKFLLLGDALSPASRDRLIAWMKGNKTGDKRLRASLKNKPKIA